MVARKRVGIGLLYRPASYIGRRSRFLGLDFWAPEKFKNTVSILHVYFFVHIFSLLLFAHWPIIGSSSFKLLPMLVQFWKNTIDLQVDQLYFGIWSSVFLWRGNSEGGGQLGARHHRHLKICVILCKVNIKNSAISGFYSKPKGCGSGSTRICTDWSYWMRSSVRC